MPSLRAAADVRRAAIAIALTLATVLVVAAAVAPPLRTHAQTLTQVTFVSASRAPSAVTAGSTDVPFLNLTATVSAATARIDRLTRTGTAADGDTAVDGIRLWFDANGNGLVDGVDQLLDTATFLQGVALLKPDFVVAWTAPALLIVTVDVRPTAGAGSTLGLQIDSATSLSLSADALIAGDFPADSGLATILALPDSPSTVGAGTSVSGNTTTTVQTADGLITATVPAGATAVDLIVSLALVDSALLPDRPGTPASAAYRLTWSATDGATPQVLAAAVRIELDLAAIMQGGEDHSQLTVIALTANGAWQALPSTLSADGLRLIISVSVEVTFSLVILPGAVADLLPPAGGVVVSADGTAQAILPAGAVTEPVLLSLTPSHAPAPTLPGSSRAVGTPLAFRQQNPATGEPADLSAPITLALQTPDLSDVPGCESPCAVAVYAIPSDGGTPVPVPSRLSNDGLHVLIDVSVDVTLVLVAGPDIASGTIAAGAAGVVVSVDGRIRLAAPAGAEDLTVTVGPVVLDPAIAAQVGSDLVFAPQHVAFAEGAAGAGRSGRETTLEIALDALAPNVDPAQLQAFGVPAHAANADAATPRLLPAVVDTDAGLVRIAVNVDTTVFLTQFAACRGVPLEAGWNLVTFSGPEGMPAPFLHTLLGDRLIAVDRWNAGDRRYDTYFPALPISQSLQRFRAEDALWVLIADGPALAWCMADTPPASRSVALHPGWNLVSWAGPDTPAPELLAPLRHDLISVFVWDPHTASLNPLLLAIGPIFPTLVSTRDAMWLLVAGDIPVTWNQPGAGPGG